jgi:hypothetical protein
MKNEKEDIHDVSNISDFLNIPYCADPEIAVNIMRDLTGNNSLKIESDWKEFPGSFFYYLSYKKSNGEIANIGYHKYMDVKEFTLYVNGMGVGLFLKQQLKE